MIPRIKLSETPEKITNPGLKDVYRIYDADGHAVADLITRQGEELDLSSRYDFVDPIKPWKRRAFENCTAKKLQVKIIEAGKRTSQLPSAKEIASYVDRQLREEIWDTEQRFENPHIHYLDMSPAYYEMKMDMLETNR